MQADTPVFIETMRVENGRVPLLEVHADRLLWGLYQCDISVDVLQTRKLFMEAVMVQAADLSGLHRLRCEVRIQAGRPFCSFSSSIFHSSCSRLTIGAYVDSQKPASFPWNAKTTDREIYKAALKWAISKGWEDAVVFSEEGLVADACIYSVFVWKDGILFTPPAADMPVRSVFKEWLMRNTVFPIIERSLSAQDLRDADLIILSNAVRMMQIGVWIDAIEA